MISFLGFVLMHLVGAALLAVATRVPWKVALRSTTPVWVTLAVLGACALGLRGAGVLLVLAGGAYLLREHGLEASPLPRKGLAFFAAFVLARPWVPTQWDEFVWLGKARFESLAFGGVAAAGLDPHLNVVPGGYPPLWPSAVGWIALRHDSLQAHVVAGSLLLLLAAATALASVLPLLRERRSWVWALVLMSAPLVWVHARSTYVDLPIGLLGVALLGRLLAPRITVSAVVIAVVLAGFKDEGLAVVLAATVGALAAKRWHALWLPLTAAAVTVATWRLLVDTSGVPFDHALGTLRLRWLPRLVELLALHATDVFTWGVFWAVVAASVIHGVRRPEGRPFVLMLAVNLTVIAAVLISATDRVREFAEGGTVLNRLLIQQWPIGVVLVLLRTMPEAGTVPSAVPVS